MAITTILYDVEGVRPVKLPALGVVSSGSSDAVEPFRVNSKLLATPVQAIYILVSPAVAVVIFGTSGAVYVTYGSEDAVAPTAVMTIVYSVATMRSVKDAVLSAGT